MSKETSPVFEIHAGPRAIKIWADGRIEGYSSDGFPCRIINRIPALLASAKKDLTDEFAMAVCAGNIGWASEAGGERELARRSYVVARAMIEERDREG